MHNAIVSSEMCTVRLKPREMDLNMARQQIINTNGGNPETAGILINGIVNRYEIENPKPDSKPTDRVYLAWYRSLLLYIGEQVKGNITDMDTLNAIFKNIYIPLSLKYGITPKVLDFSYLVGIDITVIYRYFNNPDNPKAFEIWQQWQQIARESIITELIDTPGSNVNSIFVLKAVFSLNDNPVQDNSPARIKAKRTREEIIAELVENPEKHNM